MKIEKKKASKSKGKFAAILKSISQKSLFKISLIISLIGVFLLLFLSNFLEPRQINIEEITSQMLNEKVKIQATIFRIEDKGTLQILSVSDSTGKIDILCECKKQIQEKRIQNNQEIIVIGKIEEYKEYLQISADKIIKAG